MISKLSKLLIIKDYFSLICYFLIKIHIIFLNRVLSQEIAYNVFKYFPKNRILTNTFKTILNEQSIANMGNEYSMSTELVLTNVNNSWERREASANINDHIHSLTDTNILNLYDNIDRRGIIIFLIKIKNIYLETPNLMRENEMTGMMKPAFSLNNLEKYSMQNKYFIIFSRYKIFPQVKK